MTTPTPETPSLAELKRLRKAATRGPWMIDDEVIGDGGYEPARIMGISKRSGEPYCVCEMRPGSAEDSDARLIVELFNHAVQIAESLERENAELREELESFVQYGYSREVAQQLLAKYNKEK